MEDFFVELSHSNQMVCLADLQYRNQISKEGCLIITSDRTRFQHLNVADALEKLRELIRGAEPVQAAELSPETLEKLRRRREKAARERLQVKRSRSSLKSQRGAASSSDV
jgi:peptidyl-tRNA hydrolase ICT1